MINDPTSPYANRPNAGEALAGIQAPPERKVRYGRSPQDTHEWEWAAQELYDYLRNTPEKLAAAMMPSGRAPFTTSAPAPEQVDFWLTRLVLPDGSLNEPAVQELLAVAEPDEVHALAKAIRARRLGEGPPARGRNVEVAKPEPPSDEEEY